MEETTLFPAPPETYLLPPTLYVPNSPLPVLVYRNVLPTPYSEESCQAFIEKHGWERQGILWKAIYKRHFHPNVHECYGIISGSSEVLMGVGTGDMTVNNDASPGLRLILRAGDVIVHPAGTAHSNVSDEGGYRYISLFPAGSPHWRSENGEKPLDLDAVRAETMAVPMPEDPVLGGKGYLRPLWEDAINIGGGGVGTRSVRST